MVKDCFDDPTVNIALSPREIRLVMLAMNYYDYSLSQEMDDDTIQRWDSVLNYVKDQALAYGA
jgi:hypothetical protein